MNAEHAYIGLGSNLNEPRTQILTALQELDELPKTRVITTSSLYISEPMGPSEQPDFVNAVAKITTKLDPEELLDGLHQIERKHQRKRDGDRWGPRTLDLDIILFADQEIDSKRLKIPHSGVAEREFVLIPLQEIDADLIIPGKGALSELVKQLPPYRLTKIET